MASPAISSFNSSSLFSVVGLSLPDLPCDIPPLPFSSPLFRSCFGHNFFDEAFTWPPLPSPPLPSLPFFLRVAAKGGNRQTASGRREGGDKNGVFEAQNHRLRTLEMLYGGTNCACLGYYEAFW